MKRKLIFCTMVLSALLLGGCAQKNAQGAEKSTMDSASSASTEAAQTHSQNGTQNATQNTTQNATQGTAQSTAQSGDHTAQNNGDNKTMISEEKAKEIALTHAGLTTDQVTFVKSGIDRDNGHVNYDVEFYTKDQKEYDYEIDAYTGEVLDVDYDAEYYPQISATQEGDGISADKAKEIALAKVPGATTQDIREFKSDYDNGKLEYEGKIYYDKKEYEFEIDGSSGTILEWDVEPIYG